jgi:Flp pilus assembly protein TadD
VRMRERPIPDMKITSMMQQDHDIRIDEDTELNSNEVSHLEAIWKTVQDSIRKEQIDTELFEEQPSQSHHLYEHWIETQASDYQFEVENPYLQHERPLEEASQLMASGTVATAVLALEAAVQQNLHNSDTWFKLGMAQAENEKEDAAIIALRRAIQLDPNHLPSWMVREREFMLQGSLFKKSVTLL